MLIKATNDDSILPNLRLKQNQYDKIIEMAEKVDKLVDICNGRSKEKGKYIYYILLLKMVIKIKMNYYIFLIGH